MPGFVSFETLKTRLSAGTRRVELVQYPSKTIIFF